jgi:3-oxoadipate enol-lactonase
VVHKNFTILRALHVQLVGMKYSYLLVCLLALGCAAAPPEVTSGYVDVAGARLYYEEAGEGSPLVMIHGGMLDRRMWDGQFEAFARSHRAIRYDVRAHGLSRADSVPFTDHDDLRRLMDSLHVSQAVIMGLSMGGQIALDFTLTNPERVRGLVLVGPGMPGWDFDSDEFATYIEEMTAAIETEDFATVIEVFTQWLCDGPHREPGQVDSVVRRRVLDMVAGSGQRWDLMNMVSGLDPPTVERLDEIRVPTLAVVGSIDLAVVREIADHIVERIPGAQRVVIPDVAHMVNMEQPEVFNDVVAEFLSELER